MVISHRVRLAALAVAVGLLALAWWAAVQGLDSLNRAKQGVLSNQAELRQLRAMLPALEQHEQFARNQQALQAQIAAAGLEPARWTSRKVQRTAAALPRRDAELLMRQSSAGLGAQWLVLDRLDVAGVSPAAGLFTPALADDRGFNMDLAGTLYFPLDFK